MPSKGLKGANGILSVSGAANYSNKSYEEVKASGYLDYMAELFAPKGLVYVGELPALTGNSMGSIALLGSTLVPEMEKRGYKKPMSLGPILGSGGLAIMIPPSGLAALLGVIAELSIGQILIAIILPGIIMAILYAFYIVGRCANLQHPGRSQPSF